MIWPRNSAPKPSRMNRRPPLRPAFSRLPNRREQKPVLRPSNLRPTGRNWPTPSASSPPPKLRQPPHHPGNASRLLPRHRGQPNPLGPPSHPVPGAKSALGARKSSKTSKWSRNSSRPAQVRLIVTTSPAKTKRLDSRAEGDQSGEGSGEGLQASVLAARVVVDAEAAEAAPIVAATRWPNRGLQITRRSCSGRKSPDRSRGPNVRRVGVAATTSVAARRVIGARCPSAARSLPTAR